MTALRCACCGLPRVPGVKCLHGGPPEASPQHLREQARKRKANSKLEMARMGGLPTHREVQDAAARISPTEARHRAFWTRKKVGSTAR